MTKIKLHRVHVYLNNKGWHKEIGIMEVTERPKVYIRIDGKQIKKSKMDEMRNIIESNGIYTRMMYGFPHETNVKIDRMVESILAEITRNKQRVDATYKFANDDQATIPSKIIDFDSIIKDL